MRQSFSAYWWGLQWKKALALTVKFGFVWSHSNAFTAFALLKDSRHFLH
jgi:hypothetical protein